MWIYRSKKWRQRVGLMAGAGVSLLMMWFTVFVDREMVAKGPLNTGHESLACEDCHRPAPGTVRQQIQGIFRHLFHNKEAVEFGTVPVRNRICLNCHENPTDRHPVYRFLEPRFEKVRANMAVHQCMTCHREHLGVRVSLHTGTFCAHCHLKIEIEKDPLNVPHKQLAKEERWDSCLQCHDFHGNHHWQWPIDTNNAIPVSKIQDYFDGGPSPYGERILKAKK